MASSYVNIPSTSGGAIDSVFARTGAVTAMSGDYTASEVTNVPVGGISATDVQTAINELDSKKEPAITVLPVSKGGTGAAGYTANSIIFSDGTALAEDNAHFTWDNTDKTLEVVGNIYAASGATDFVAVTGELHATTSTTVDGSNNTSALQLSALATISAGATNDKAASGVVSTIMRGDGTDDGALAAIAGAISLIFHNSGPAGITNEAYGYSSIFITEQGTITDLYDFFSQRAPAGGDVTNHYGIYISADSATPVKNWLSGATLIGGTSFSAPSAALEIVDDKFILQSAKTPATAADTGVQGTICWDNDYIYVCTATDTWKRTSLGTW